MYISGERALVCLLCVAGLADSEFANGIGAGELDVAEKCKLSPCSEGTLSVPSKDLLLLLLDTETLKLNGL